MAGSTRTFETGANRDTDVGKHDYEGFLSPLVMERFGEYMTKNRKLADGSIRDSDNWQRGMPLSVYIKSAFRHFHAWWMGHRGYVANEGLEDALCGLLFNVQGYLHELLKERKANVDLRAPKPVLVEAAKAPPVCMAFGCFNYGKPMVESGLGWGCAKEVL